MDYLHGIETLTVDNVPRSIRTARSSVIGIVGTAPDADPDLFPLNEPVLVMNARDARGLDTVGDFLGTLPDAMDAIYRQAGATCVVVRVAEEEDIESTISNVIGGTDAQTGEPLGIEALRAAQSKVGLVPRILCVPEFTSFVTREELTDKITASPVINALVPVANTLRGFIYADGPNTTDAEAVQFRETIGSQRVMIVDPYAKVWDAVTNKETIRGASAYYAGVRSRLDTERGFHWNISNQPIYGLTGVARPIDVSLGARNTRANYLNENEVSTIVNLTGYRTWGGRTCSDDEQWAFENHVRIHDMILESLVEAHLWALDRNIDRNYADAVTEGVNAYLRDLEAREIISGGTCSFSEERNTISTMEQGQAFFSFDYGRYGVAEHIIFEAAVNNDYTVEQLFK
jgi:phage tail sheath protein FI